MRLNNVESINMEPFEDYILVLCESESFTTRIALSLCEAEEFMEILKVEIEKLKAVLWKK